MQLPKVVKASHPLLALYAPLLRAGLLCLLLARGGNWERLVERHRKGQVAEERLDKPPLHKAWVHEKLLECTKPECRHRVVGRAPKTFWLSVGFVLLPTLMTSPVLLKGAVRSGVVAYGVILSLFLRLRGRIKLLPVEARCEGPALFETFVATRLAHKPRLPVGIFLRLLGIPLRWVALSDGLRLLLLSLLQLLLVGRRRLE